MMNRRGSQGERRGSGSTSSKPSGSQNASKSATTNNTTTNDGNIEEVFKFKKSQPHLSQTQAAKKPNPNHITPSTPAAASSFSSGSSLLLLSKSQSKMHSAPNSKAAGKAGAGGKQTGASSNNKTSQPPGGKNYKRKLSFMSTKSSVLSADDGESMGRASATLDSQRSDSSDNNGSLSNGTCGSSSGGSSGGGSSGISSHSSSNSNEADWASASANKEPPLSVNDIVCMHAADLHKMTYSNESEAYLIKRLYSHVGRLSAALQELSAADFAYYLNTPDENDCLPLYYAIKAECVSTMSYLIERGADIHRTTALGDPAPHLACLLGVSTPTLDYLLAFDPVRLLYANDQEGWTPLHCSANQGHLTLVKHLLEQKHVNPNVLDARNRFSCLQLAAMNGRLDVVEYLLSFNTVSSITDKHRLLLLNQQHAHTNNNNNHKKSEHKSKSVTPESELSHTTSATTTTTTATANSGKDKLAGMFFSPASAQHSSTTGGGHRKRSTQFALASSVASSLGHAVAAAAAASSSGGGSSGMRRTMRGSISSRHSIVSAASSDGHALLLKTLVQLNERDDINSSSGNPNNHSNNSSGDEMAMLREMAMSDETTTSSRRQEEDATATKAAHMPRLLSTIEYVAARRNPTFAYDHVDTSLVYKNKTFVIDVASRNSEGQNVLHLACRYAKLDVVRLLLAKYGSHELDVNSVDYKGRTCLDLAWKWLSTDSSVDEHKIWNEKFNGPKLNSTLAAMQLQHHDHHHHQQHQNGDEESDRSESSSLSSDLLSLLISYGAKFSRVHTILYDVDALSSSSSSSRQTQQLDNDDGERRRRRQRPSDTHAAALMAYFRLLTHLLNYNLSKMFLHNENDDTSTTSNNGHVILAANMRRLLDRLPQCVEDAALADNFADVVHSALHVLATKQF